MYTSQTAEIQERLMHTTEPLSRALTETQARIKGMKDKLIALRAKADGLRNRIHELVGRDPKALVIRTWQKVMVLGIVAVLGVALNYLAAEGLLVDRPTTIFITLTLTALEAWLAWAFAREAIKRRRDQVAGVVRRRKTWSWIAVHGLVLGVYVIASTVLRERYLALNDAVAHSLFGTTPGTLSPWVISIVLTGISVGLLALAAYVLAHCDDERAACQDDLEKTEGTIDDLEQSLRGAEEHLQQTLKMMGGHVIRAHAEAMQLMRENGELPQDTKGQAEISDRILHMFWLAATGDVSGKPDNPENPPTGLAVVHPPGPKGDPSGKLAEIPVDRPAA